MRISFTSVVLPVLLIGLAVVPVAAQEEPGLPPGLGGDEPTEEQPAEAPPAEAGWRDRLPRGLHGFWELRAGPRTGSDPLQPDDFTLAETRLQLDYLRSRGRAEFQFKTDLVADAVEDELEHDPRQLRLSLRLGDVDLRLGRQVLTWGTGDMLFVNDLFPKDWVSFFVGRDREYLKAPSDAVRIGWYPSAVSLELVYTPQFDPDRFIRGERISFRDPGTGAFAGNAQQADPLRPDDWLDDDEIAVRAYRAFGSWEAALYGYRGFWKSPAGFDPAAGRATFPRLDVWGASVRGPVGPGIGSLEAGWYDSRDDPAGADPLVDNSQLRWLAGYEQELARELTGGFQYYVERMLDHGRYRATLPGGPPRDETRHVATLRLTRLLRSQTVSLSLFGYLGLSDRDAYLRPRVSWDIDDNWSLEAGANLFAGEHDYTFFGQFEAASNLYAAVRLSL